MTHRVAAIVPMRRNSQRVPKKNYREFAGEPLYRHIIRSLIHVQDIDQIVIDTDSPEIMEDAASIFPDVIILERPIHLRDAETPMNDVLLHTVEQIDSQFFLQTHSTNPLLRPQTITSAINQFTSNYPSYDTLFAVTRLQTRLWDQLARPINHNSKILLQTQDLPPVYEENSNLYIFTAQTLKQRYNRIGERPIMFEVDRLESWDIDDEDDFQIAELLFHAHYASNRTS